MTELLSSPTPDHASPFTPTMRRAFTLPARLVDSSASVPPYQDPQDVGAETFFVHPAGKIVFFSSTSNSARLKSSNGRGQGATDDEPAGTLPWASRLETTVAAGPLNIYRKDTVPFLNCGKINRPMLAKSQCWCVDGVSKFALRTGPKSYYRIELPNSTVEDAKSVEELKQVLSTIIQYEVTPCPFKRSFTVDLPEVSPVQLRPWRPRQQSQSMEDKGADSPNERTTVASSRSGVRTTATDLDPVANNTVASAFEDANECSDLIIDHLETPTRPHPVGSRAFTAPSNTLAMSLPLSKGTLVPSESNADCSDSLSLSSSVESFHSFTSFPNPISPLPPSPPYSDPPSPTLQPSVGAGAALPRNRHKRDMSDITVTTHSPERWDMTRTPTRRNSGSIASLHHPKTPSKENGDLPPSSEISSEMQSPPPSTQLRRRRAISPLPSSSNLYSPQSRMSRNHLTLSLLQKTCYVLLGPPIHIVALMLQIAKKIANGNFSRSAFASEDTPHAWDHSDGDEARDEVWAEDDYGIALGTPAARSRRARDLGNSWEID